MKIEKETELIKVIKILESSGYRIEKDGAKDACFGKNPAIRSGILFI